MVACASFVFRLWWDIIIFFLFKRKESGIFISIPVLSNFSREEGRWSTPSKGEVKVGPGTATNTIYRSTPKEPVGYARAQTVELIRGHVFQTVPGINARLTRASTHMVDSP